MGARALAQGRSSTETERRAKLVLRAALDVFGGLTQRGFAAAIDVGEQLFNAWAHKDRPNIPDPDGLDRLADRYDELAASLPRKLREHAKRMRKAAQDIRRERGG